jgi:ribosomal protein S18 acetylase RimI-like enzyme
MAAVRLRPVQPSEHDDWFAMLDVYLRELDPYDPDEHAAEAHSVELYRAAILDDLGPDSGRELLWIEADGERAGLLMVRTLPDFPDDSTNVADIAEFYVDPAFRRRGVGRAGVEALLAEHRGRGTRLVEAGILHRNLPAQGFWRALGFEPRSILTGRRP